MVYLRKLSPAFLFLIIAAIGISCSARKTSESKKQNSGVTKSEKNWLDSISSSVDLKTIQEFDSLNDYNPLNDSTDYRGIATVLISRGNYDLAIDKIDEELRLNPNNADALHLKGQALDEGGYPTLAMTFFNRAIAINNTVPEFFYNRGLVFYKLGYNKKAIEDYSRTLELNPRDSWTYYNRAKAYSELRDFNSAIEDYTKDLKINGKSVRTLNNRGNCFMSMGNYEKALNDFNLVLEIEPNKANTIYNIGILYLKQDLFEQGCPYIERAVGLGFPGINVLNDYCR